MAFDRTDCADGRDALVRCSRSRGDHRAVDVDRYAGDKEVGGVREHAGDDEELIRDLDERHPDDAPAQRDRRVAYRWRLHRVHHRD